MSWQARKISVLVLSSRMRTSQYSSKIQVDFQVTGLTTLDEDANFNSI